MTNQSRKNFLKVIDLLNDLFTLQLKHDRTQGQLDEIISLRLYVYSR